MADASCPNCGHDMGIPGAFHGSPTMTVHSHRECPNCKRPLIWFKDGQELPEGWLIDEDEERARRRRQ